jgi:uncharacterized protein YdgA (DUF945 family)
VNKLAKIALAVAALLALLIALPLALGMQFEKQYRAAIAQLPSNALYHFRIEHYERGLRSAHVVTVLDLTPPKGEPLHVRFDSQVEHGPYAGFGQARITTTVESPPEIAAALQPLFGASSPLVSIITVGPTGRVSGTLVSPAARTQPGTPVAVDWKGFTLHHRSGGGRMEVDGDLPGLTVTDASGAVLLDVGAARIAANGNKGERSGLWLGSGAIDVASVKGGAAPKNVDLRALHFDGDSAEQGDVVRLGYGMTAAHFGAGAEAVDDAVLKVSYNDLDAAALKRMQEIGESMQPQAGEADDAFGRKMIEAFKEVAPQLLARKPWFGVDELSLKYQGTPISAKARVQYVGSGNIDAFSPMTDLAGSASIEAPQAAARRLVKAQQLRALQAQAAIDRESGGTAPSDDFLDQEAAHAADQYIEGLVQQGVLIAVGADRYKTEATFEQGQLRVNGKPYPPRPE